jgi:membrane protease YdiL (CAAX protease family)
MSPSNTSQVVSSVSPTNEQHSIGRSLALHILPGIFILALFVASVPLATRAGLPPLFAMVTFGTAFGLGFQVWHLYSEGKKRNGKASLEGIVLYRKPMPLWQYFALVPTLVILGFLIDGVTAPLKSAIMNSLPWLPQWFEMRDASLLAAYSRPALVITFACSLLFNGIAAPIVEELYFRGYLMPRLSRFGRWTPVLETALFTLYHFWQPYYWITQFIFMLPVVSAVSWKKNIKLGIIVHMALNLLGGLLLAAMVLGKM